MSLNGYSWTSNDDESEEEDQDSTELSSEDDLSEVSLEFVPYTINAIFPSTGPITGGTEILIIGSGFVEDSDESPRCRFGTPSNYAIV